MADLPLASEQILILLSIFCPISVVQHEHERKMDPVRVLWRSVHLGVCPDPLDYSFRPMRVFYKLEVVAKNPQLRDDSTCSSACREREKIYVVCKL